MEKHRQRKVDLERQRWKRLCRRLFWGAVPLVWVAGVGSLHKAEGYLHFPTFQRPLLQSRFNRCSKCVHSSPFSDLSLRKYQRQLQTTRRQATNPGMTVTTPMGNTYMGLLALQFAFQPLVTKSFASKSIIKGTYVFSLDVVRALICVATLCLTGSWVSATSGWHWRQAALSAGLPSMLYVAQNYFALQAYQNLSPITFNVLNQTKTLSAACWCYILLGQQLGLHQIWALGFLLLAAMAMECSFSFPMFSTEKLRLGRFSFKTKNPAMESSALSSTPTTVHDPWLTGILPVLLASLLSGLAGALAQRSLQTHARNSLLFSLELAFCSMITSILTLGILPTPDHRRLRREGWWQGWTILTWVPLLLQASGGVLVGLVTKYAGSVRKGFCLILGMFLSGILQNLVDREGSNHVRREQWMGGILAAISFWMYTQ